MGKVVITADSTCDLSSDLVEKYGIVVVPLYVITGETEHRDGVDITPNGLFEYVRQTGVLPKTAACTVEDYTRVWKPYLDEGASIVHLNISSEFSSCYQNAVTAAQALKNVYPVDSRNLSTGIGLLVLDAAEMAAQGMDAKEIFDTLEQKKQRLNVSFVIDTMEYLAKGGRCSSVVALAAGLLRLKPCISVNEGRMGVSKKYRGKLRDVLMLYVHERLKAAGEVELKRIFITDSGVSEDIVREVREAILKEAPFSEILHTNAGCTVCSHCGPGTLGILFYEAEK
ncbi:MAG: DegV family protein [Clostridia bacterium]|nr:DegV family protein [Clostridia bacterium]